MRVFAMVFSISILAACAKDVSVVYPEPRPGVAHGRMLIKFTEPIRQVHVQVDGELVVEEKYTDRVTIENIPAGTRDVEIAASENHRTQAVHVRRTVDVQAGRTTTVLVGTPPVNSGFWTYLAVMAASYWLAFLR